MAPPHDATPARRRALVSAACALLACVLSLVAPADALQRFGEERAAVLVDALASLGGLQDANGTVTARPLPVHVTQEGGPLWLTPTVSTAADAHPAFEVGAQAPNLLRVEVIADEQHLVTQGALYRQGWNLRLPQPLRARLALWIPLAGLVVGLGVFGWRRRAGLAVAVAGALAHAGAAAWPWPRDVPPLRWLEAVREGPAGRLVRNAADALPESSVAIGAGVVTLCAVLMAFDHRRSTGRGGAMLASGLVGVLGAIAWIEVAGRCGVWAWMGTWPGAVAACAMALAWGLQARTLASLHRAPRPSQGPSTAPSPGASPPASSSEGDRPTADD